MTLRRPSPRRLRPHDPHHRHIRLPGDPEAENCEENPSHLSCLFRRVLCTDDRGSAPRQTLPRRRDKQMNKLMTLKERAREADDDCELLDIKLDGETVPLYAENDLALNHHLLAALYRLKQIMPSWVGETKYSKPFVQRLNKRFPIMPK